MRPIVDNKRRGGRCFSGRHFHSSESESQVLVANRQDKKKNKNESAGGGGGDWRPVAGQPERKSRSQNIRRVVVRLSSKCKLLLVYIFV